MAIKKTILCDGTDCNTMLNEKNGICIRGSIHVVDANDLDDKSDSLGIGGGLIGGSNDIFYYCRRCLAKVLGFDLAVKRELDTPRTTPSHGPIHTPPWPYNSPNDFHTTSNDESKPNWYRDK